MTAKILHGKIIISGIIHTETGLHIGAGSETIEIGSLDNPVIIDPVTKQPYIPGSSLKGKTRSLFERVIAKRVKPNSPESFFNRKSGRGVFIHVCDTKEDAYKCPVCRLFGSTAEGRENLGSNFPSRLKFRDAYFTPYTAKKLEEAETDLLYTEIKNENVLDRVTAASNPRPVERVPRDSDFMFEIVYDVEDLEQLKEDLENLLFALSLLEDDYLGGNGSRGYGKVKFYFTEASAKKAEFYEGKKEGMKKVLDESLRNEVTNRDKAPDYEKLLTVDELRAKIDEIVKFFKP